MSDSDDPDDGAGEDSDWRFDVADVGDVNDLTIEPEPIDPVNAAFFILGILATFALVFSVVL